MADKTGLAVPTIEIDNRVIAIKPDSLSYVNGDGEINVRPQVAGAGAIEQVITVSAESQKSMVKFSLISETGNISIKDDIKQKSFGDGVVVRLSDRGFTRTFRGMRMINDPEVSIGSDADFEIELNGDPTG